MLKDLRVEKLGKMLVEYSLRIERGDKLIITAPYNARPLVFEVVRAAKAVGAIPYVEYSDDELTRAILCDEDEESLNFRARKKMATMQEFDATLRIFSPKNEYEMSAIPKSWMQKNARAMAPISDYMVNNMKWSLLNYPNEAMAARAKMTTEDYYEYVFNVSTLDYPKMAKAIQPLKDLMERTDKVHIKSPGTDLNFSIKDIPAIICAGDCNVPDGEVYTAPVRNSINGVLKYNTPSPYLGDVYEGVTLTFENGKIINATSNANVEGLNAIFNTDEGARYVGEFAIGVNPLISEPMGDILYDEKIHGSFHFTPGRCYDEASNGNDSAIHWDMVQIQRPEYGGGEIYFDGVLIRKDGLFVIDELKPLNPENLI